MSIITNIKNDFMRYYFFEDRSVIHIVVLVSSLKITTTITTIH